MDFTPLGTLFKDLVDYVFPHAPFVGATIILLVIGHRLSTRVFTRQRAYRYYGASAKGKWTWRFFYWGRELLPIIPIMLGVALGLLWRDPENRGWNRAATVGYFASAGALSMCAWAVIKGWAKKKDIVLALPGESDAPDGVEVLPYDSIQPPAVIVKVPAVPTIAQVLQDAEDDTRPTTPPARRL